MFGCLFVCVYGVVYVGLFVCCCVCPRVRWFAVCPCGDAALAGIPTCSSTSSRRGCLAVRIGVAWWPCRMPRRMVVCACVCVCVRVSGCPRVRKFVSVCVKLHCQRFGGFHTVSLFVIRFGCMLSFGGFFRLSVFVWLLAGLFACLCVCFFDCLCVWLLFRMSSSPLFRPRVRMSAYVSVFVCLFVCLFVRLFICCCVCLFVCILLCVSACPLVRRVSVGRCCLGRYLLAPLPPHGAAAWRCASACLDA